MSEAGEHLHPEKHPVKQNKIKYNNESVLLASKVLEITDRSL